MQTAISTPRQCVQLTPLLGEGNYMHPRSYKDFPVPASIIYYHNLFDIRRNSIALAKMSLAVYQEKLKNDKSTSEGCVAYCLDSPRCMCKHCLASQCAV